MVWNSLCRPGWTYPCEGSSSSVSRMLDLKICSITHGQMHGLFSPRDGNLGPMHARQLLWTQLSMIILPSAFDYELCEGRTSASLLKHVYSEFSILLNEHKLSGKVCWAKATCSWGNTGDLISGSQIIPVWSFTLPFTVGPGGQEGSWL